MAGKGKKRAGRRKAKAGPKPKRRELAGRPWAPDDMAESLVVEDYAKKQVYGIGSPGMLTLNTFFMQGNEDKVRELLPTLFALIEIDLPFYIPIHDDDYTVNLGGEEVQIRHRTKRRGQEDFSTVDSRITPYFSSLKIRTDAFIDRTVPSEFDPPDQEGAYFYSLVLIFRIIKKIEDFLAPSLNIRLLEVLPRVSYRVTYGDRRTRTGVAQTTYPMSGAIRIRSPIEQLQVDNAALKDFLAASFQVAAFATQEVAPATEARPFLEQVFLSLHSFAYYCRQHAGSLAGLSEEHIRDLFLIVLKSVFHTAEGEPYHFDGKLDFKVVNPAAPHEFVTGEFKWWDGPTSAREMFHQAFRKHATGQEAEIHCLLLSRNADAAQLFETAVGVLKDEEEVEAGTVQPRALPPGSRERWVSADARIRANAIPMSLGLADLFHEKK